MQLRTTVSAITLGTALLSAGCADISNPTGVPDLTPVGPATLGASLIDTWTVVATKTVTPAHQTKVKGSRYTLTFPPRSVRADLTVTISERDPNVVDVDFNPEGWTFLRPVTLKINYRGTANDPASPDYNGQKPQLFSFNADSQSWVLVPGTDDPVGRIYTVKLRHFSRYAMNNGTIGGERGDNAHRQEKN